MTLQRLRLEYNMYMNCEYVNETPPSPPQYVVLGKTKFIDDTDVFICFNREGHVVFVRSVNHYLEDVYGAGSEISSMLKEVEGQLDAQDDGSVTFGGHKMVP